MAELKELLRFLVSYCASQLPIAKPDNRSIGRCARVACLRVSQARLRLKTRAAVRTQSGPRLPNPKPQRGGCPPCDDDGDNDNINRGGVRRIDAHARRRLELSHRAWQHVDEVVWTMGLEITALSLAYNRLAHIAPELGDLKLLRELDCSCNKLQALPAKIGALRQLRKLKCNGNSPGTPTGRDRPVPAAPRRSFVARISSWRCRGVGSVQARDLLAEQLAGHVPADARGRAASVEAHQPRGQPGIGHDPQEERSRGDKELILMSPATASSTTTRSRVPIRSVVHRHARGDITGRDEAAPRIAAGAEESRRGTASMTQPPDGHRQGRRHLRARAEENQDQEARDI